MRPVSTWAPNAPMATDTSANSAPSTAKFRSISSLRTRGVAAERSDGRARTRSPPAHPASLRSRPLREFPIQLRVPVRHGHPTTGYENFDHLGPHVQGVAGRHEEIRALPHLDRAH